jgi:hypothetical protein
MKRDLSKIQCYIFYEFGHYSRDCPERKRKGKKHASIVDVNPENKTKLGNDPQSDYLY